MSVERSGDQQADQAPNRRCGAFNWRVLGDQPSGISHRSVTGLIMGWDRPRPI